MKGCAQRRRWLFLAGFCFALMLTVSTGGARRGPVVRVVTPQPEEIVAGPDVVVHVEVDGLDIRPGCNSIHLMLDNEPFVVKYRTDQPHRFHDVAPGTHTLRVYAANPYHEIIPGTLSVIPFAVEYHNGQNRPECGEPLLTYVLPQGEYRGIDCADIILNFDVSGAPLSRYGYRVQYFVDGRRYLAHTKESRHLTGLAPGYHTIRMELVDEKGRLVPGPFNVVERTILLSPEKPLDQPKKREQPYLSSIQGPMTSGRLWVSRQENAEPEELTATAAARETEAQQESKGTKEISVVAARAKTAKQPALEEELAEPVPESTEPVTEEQGELESEKLPKPMEALGAKPVTSQDDVTVKKASETSPTVRARRVSLGQFRNTAQTTTTLKATSVSSTQTQFIRIGAPTSAASAPSTEALQSSSKQDKNAPAKQSDVADRIGKRESRRQKLNDERPPNQEGKSPSSSLPETTTTAALPRSIERVVGASEPVEVVENLDDALQTEQSELTATISRVISSKGLVAAYEVINE